MIRLRDIHFSYPQGPAVLQGLNLDFESGDRVGLIGPNGSGKTTLFSIIMGLTTPNKGTVEIFGKPRAKEADFAEVRRRIGLVFQDPNDQLFHPTVEEDVAFGPLNLGKSGREARQIVKETLEGMGLSGFEKRITYKLSGGEKRLVSLAGVLAMKPEALLLDEPTAGLDEKTTKRLIDILNNMNGVSLLMISHNPEALKATTNKLMTIKSGAIQPYQASSGA